MKEIHIQGRGDASRILIGESLDRLRNYLPENKVVLISDRNVAGYYRDRFPSFPLLLIEPGEGSKTLDEAGAIYRKLLEMGVDRSYFLAGIGGGVVTDLAGFVASTYMRGIPFGFVSTTLLAQVDASVGGKNGVNLDGYKNMIGSFNQPRFVLCDPEMLSTLPREEWENGLAEALKHGLIADREYFSFLEKERSGILEGNRDLIVRIVEGSVRIKAGIVNSDERESGCRRLLNFGHTAGHALEKELGISHGRAVAAGMVLAARISSMTGGISEEEVRTVISVIGAYGLPVHTRIEPEGFLKALTADKKKTGDTMSFVVLKEIGKALTRDIPMVELRRLFKTVLNKVE